MLLLIDNYDSFTWNLWHQLGALGWRSEVVRNDAWSVDDVLAAEPEAIILSPGPCDPPKAGICMPLIEAAAAHDIPLFGVCLGMQSIGAVFGGRVMRANQLMHGKVSEIEHEGKGVFAGLPSPLPATRYHSLIVEPATLPDCLEVTAQTADGCIMGLRHREHLIEGVQFHPESIRTLDGSAMMRTFLDKVAARRAAPQAA